MDSFEVILEEMTQHAHEYPTHGYNCSCRDKYLRRARALLSDGGEQYYKEFLYLADAMRRSGPLVFTT